jgi:serine/threonine protein kinase
VLVSAAGDALLCDFGLSRYVEDIISMSDSSSAGPKGGHARFMAPEILRPPTDAPPGSRLTPKSDVFAFASLMLQVSTLTLPYDMGLG